jgi:hypothetical protein
VDQVCEGWSPLRIAVHGGHAAVTALLRAAGAAE